jgi:hypothetical protein
MYIIIIYFIGEFEEMIDKLDRMMLVVFEYLAEKLKIIDKESSEEQEQALQLFTHLLVINLLLL